MNVIRHLFQTVRSRLIICAMVVSLLLSCGCFSNAAVSSTTVPSQATDSDTQNKSKEIETQAKNLPTTCKQTRKLPKLLYLGQLVLQKAIDHTYELPFYNNCKNEFQYNDILLAVYVRNARDCYTRALEVAPNNYSALLGMGIAGTIAALVEEEDKNLRASYLYSAKQMLGRAYIARQGTLETILHLAHVAIIEKDFKQAERFLIYLRETKYKPGSVYVLLGQLASRRNDDQLAEKYFRNVLEFGASSPEMAWAVYRLELLKQKKEK